MKSYLKDVTYNLKKSGTWKIQVTIAIKSMSSKNTEETKVMHSKSDNVGIMIGNKTSGIIKEFFESFFLDIKQAQIHKNKTIALNVLFSPNNREEIKQAYISKHNSKREKQVILIITDGKKWHYLATKNLLVLL